MDYPLIIHWLSKSPCFMGFRTTLSMAILPWKSPRKNRCRTQNPGFISPVQWLQVEAPEDQIPRFFWDEHIDTIYIYTWNYILSYINYIYYIVSINNIVYISYIILSWIYIYICDNICIYIYTYMGYVRVSSGVKDVEYFWIWSNHFEFRAPNHFFGRSEDSLL